MLWEMSALTQDLRYALRTFLNSPGSTVVAIVVLSLGIGASVAIFSVTNAILFRSLPYKDPERVVFVWENKLSKAMRQESLSPADFKDFQTRNQVFDRMGAIRSQSSVLTGGELPERIETAAVSPGVFEILGMEPVLGRSFASDEDQPDKNHVAILSAGLWQRRFGRDPNILGKKLSLDSGSYTVVGVAPPQFRLPENRSELWIPYTPEPADFLPSNRAPAAFESNGGCTESGASTSVKKFPNPRCARIFRVGWMGLFVSTNILRPADCNRARTSATCGYGSDRRQPVSS